MATYDEAVNLADGDVVLIRGADVKEMLRIADLLKAGFGLDNQRTSLWGDQLIGIIKRAEVGMI